MTTLSTSELTELAKRVYPNAVVQRVAGGIWVETSEYAFYFVPSLTFNDGSKSQALDCIVAAFNLPGNFSMHKMVTVKGTYFQVIRGSDPHLLQETILQAACRALLATKEQS